MPKQGKEKNFLFDCDGTLVDSEYLAMRHLCDTLVEEGAKRGKEIDPFFVMAQFGTVTGHIIQSVEEKYKIKFEPDLLERVNKSTVQLLKQKVEPTAGMAEFLDFATAQTKQDGGVIAVVTSSGFDRVIPSLERTGLIKHIDRNHIFSAVDSLNPPDPKPSPAIYLHACRTLGIDPADAKAFEDTVGGTKSAKAAGIGQIIGYVGGLHITKEIRNGHSHNVMEAGADRVFRSWQSVQKHFVNQWAKEIGDPSPEPRGVTSGFTNDYKSGLYVPING